MGFNKTIGRETCETVFGGLPEIKTHTFWGVVIGGNAVMDGNEGKWEVEIKSGLGLTGERRREMFEVFDTQEEAETFAQTNSDYWHLLKTGSRLNKGNRVK